MNTFGLMLDLSDLRSKADYLALVTNELNRLVNHFNHLGYLANAQHGLVGQQVFKSMQDAYTFQYFRDVHFIYWGLHGNWNTNDTIDELYYRGLEGFASKQYAQLL